MGDAVKNGLRFEPGRDVGRPTVLPEAQVAQDLSGRRSIDVEREVEGHAGVEDSDLRGREREVLSLDLRPRGGQAFLRVLPGDRAPQTCTVVGESGLDQVLPPEQRLGTLGQGHA